MSVVVFSQREKTEANAGDNRGFEPEWILPISLMSRSQGLLAHWKEAMCKFFHVLP